MVVRKIINNIDGKMDDIDVQKDKHWFAKAFGLGAIEGYMDAAIIMFPVVCLGLFAANKVIAQKEK